MGGCLTKNLGRLFGPPPPTLLGIPPKRNPQRERGKNLLEREGKGQTQTIKRKRDKKTEEKKGDL